MYCDGSLKGLAVPMALTEVSSYELYIANWRFWYKALYHKSNARSLCYCYGEQPNALPGPAT